MPMNSRDTCIFYRSIFEAIEMLENDKEKATIYNAIFNYSLNFIEPDLSGTCAMIWKLILPVLEKGNTNYINGSKPKKKANQKRTRSETQANNKRTVSEVEAYKDKDKDKDIDKDIDIKTKHSFCKSPYFEFSKFEEAFLQTKCYKRYPNLSIEAIHEELMLASDSNSKYKYNNWISVAQSWVNRNPAKYQNSIKKSIEQDPISPLMNKGDKIRAENDARLEAQLKLLAHEDPYSKYH